MKNKIKLLMFMGLFTYYVSAQTTTTINGSPYLDDTYVTGVVYFANRSHTAPIRYNVFQDLVEYQQNGKALVLDPNATIRKVQFGDAVLVPQKYETNGKVKFGYFAVLDSGKVTLLAKRKSFSLLLKKEEHWTEAISLRSTSVRQTPFIIRSEMEKYRKWRISSR